LIFEKETISFQLLDVLAIDQNNMRKVNVGRNFHALSYRLQSDGVIATADNVYQLCDHAVCFVPARLDYTRSASVERLIAFHFDLTDTAADEIEWFVPQNPDEIAPLFEQALALWQEKPKGYRHLCTALLYRIFAECYRQKAPDEIEETDIQLSVAYITKHLGDPTLSVKIAAEQSHISEVYFRKRFKEQYGISPRKYIVQRRIQRAVSLMATGYYSLQEVAEACGFADYKYFSVQFKKQLGVSPSKYTYNYLP